MVFLCACFSEACVQPSLNVAVEGDVGGWI